LFKLKRKTFYPANKAKIINNTGVTIPPEVVSLLEFGNKFSVGGSTNVDSSEIYLELNKLWETFLPQGRKLGVSELDIQNIRAYIQLCGKDLTGCATRDSRISAFFEFKKKFPNIVLLTVDKSHDFIFITKSEYQEKLNALFDNSDYEKIENLNLNENFKSYRALVNDTIKSCLGQSNTWLVESKNSISALYGKVKCH
jgi:hypothetical protein